MKSFDERNAERELDICQVALEMTEAGLSPRFVTEVMEVAKEHRGVYELLKTWQIEPSCEERDEIVADLQDDVDMAKEGEVDYFGKSHVTPACEGLAVKYKLEGLVYSWGGITRLSKETGIPEASLERFFSSTSAPRVRTVVRILDALVSTGGISWSSLIDFGALEKIVRAN